MSKKKILPAVLIWITYLAFFLLLWFLSTKLFVRTSLKENNYSSKETLLQKTLPKRKINLISRPDYEIYREKKINEEILISDDIEINKLLNKKVENSSIKTSLLTEKNNWDMLASELNCTGFYANKGDSLEIEYKTNEEKTKYYEPVIIVKGIVPYRVKKVDKYPLKKGVTFVEVKSDGIIYLKDNLSAKRGNYYWEINLRKGGIPFPMFKLNLHTDEDWEFMLNNFTTTPYVSLIGENNIITVTKTSAQQYLKKPSLILKTLDNIVDILAEKQYGLKKINNNKITNLKSKRKVHHFEDKENILVAKDEQGKKTLGTTTNHFIGYNTTQIENLLNLELLKKEAWVVWHELGHLFSMNFLIFEDSFNEVLANYSALYLEKALGNKRKINDISFYARKIIFNKNKYNEEKIHNYLNSEKNVNINYQLNLENNTQSRNVITIRTMIQKDFFAPNHIITDEEKLLMFWQLTEKLGDNFFVKLTTNYRLFLENRSYSELIKDKYLNLYSKQFNKLKIQTNNIRQWDSQKQQNFIYFSNISAECNLLPFFNKWGIFANENTIKKIKDSKKIMNFETNYCFNEPIYQTNSLQDNSDISRQSLTQEKNIWTITFNYFYLFFTLINIFMILFHKKIKLY